MKKLFNLLILLASGILLLNSCEDMDDTINVPSDLQVQNFIWKGLNQFYVWQSNVPDLSDKIYRSPVDQNNLNTFLYTKGTPENLFQDLLNKPISKFPDNANGTHNAIDRFSVLVDDYTYLENFFQGITTNNGVDFGLRYKSGTSGPVFGWVRYIIPNSDASNKNIHRGDIFYAVNGIPLYDNSPTDTNYQSLLGNETYTLNLADYNNGNITPNGKSVTLTKTQLTENPVLYSQVINAGNHKVAYLIYNGFITNFETQLNTVFGQFTSEGATDLVLDLRYNSGGSVDTATRLASMVTGQFNGQLFAKEVWNSKVQPYYEENYPSRIFSNFTTTLGNGTGINSMRLSKVYILTSKGTASASELVINGLKPYVDVIQIGDVTTGKNAGSITLYDSPTFGKSNRNGSHKYAMQPLVFKTANKAGFGEYENGLQPTMLLKEDLANLSELGNTNEPLLSAALGIIIGSGRMIKPNLAKDFKEFKDSKSLQPFGTDMYFNSVEK